MATKVQGPVIYIMGNTHRDIHNSMCLQEKDGTMLWDYTTNRHLLEVKILSTEELAHPGDVIIFYPDGKIKVYKAQ